MPTELEELVEFLHHGNTQIRQVAAENLVQYSKTQPSLFKRNQFEPIKDLKLLIKDYAPIKQNVLTMLVNLSGDRDILEVLAPDDAFLESVLLRITNPKERSANDLGSLLANLSKHPSLKRLFTLSRARAPSLGNSPIAIDQLMDLFVRGARGSWNPSADYDHLAYLIADLAKYSEGTDYLTTPQSYDNVYPLAKLLPFTAVEMPLARRLGVASTVKNVAFTLEKHPELLGDELGLLRYVLVPLVGGEDQFDEEEQEGMIEDLQLLDPDVKRDASAVVLKTHLETMLILSTQRGGRKALRDAGTYYVIRELHKGCEDEGVQEAIDRLVQVLQRGEPEGLEDGGVDEVKLIRETEGPEEDDEDDEDDQIVQVL